MVNPCDTPMIRKLYRERVVSRWEIIEKETVDEIIFRTVKVRNRLILELMARGGMRIGEVLKLRLNDIQDRKLILREPKSGKEHEIVFIPQKVADRLRDCATKKCKSPQDRIFPISCIKTLSPVHSFRHSCAVNMLTSGCSLSDIRNQLGHEALQATMVYLQLDLTHRRKIQKKFIEFNRAVLIDHPEIEELINPKDKDDIMAWLDSL